MSEIQKALRTLGVDSGASFEEITEAYRDLIKVWHPDRHASDPGLQERAQEKLKEITRAYEVLKADEESGSGFRRRGPGSRAAAGGGPGARPRTGSAGPARDHPLRRPGFIESIPGWVLVIIAIGLVVALRSGKLLPGLGILVVYLIVHGIRRVMSPGA